MKPQHSAKKRGKPMKSELVMILAAMASALVLMGMLIACIPYYDTGTREIADPEPLLQQAALFLHQRLTGGVPHQHQKFVAAEAAHNVRGAEGLRQHVADGPQQRVASEMTHAVVDGFEIIQINHKQTQFFILMAFHVFF